MTAICESGFRSPFGSTPTESTALASGTSGRGSIAFERELHATHPIAPTTAIAAQLVQRMHPSFLLSTGCVAELAGYCEGKMLSVPGVQVNSNVEATRQACEVLARAPCSVPPVQNSTVLAGISAFTNSRHSTL